MTGARAVPCVASLLRLFGQPGKKFMGEMLRLQTLYAVIFPIVASKGGQGSF